jgi:hypothetical protein
MAITKPVNQRLFGRTVIDSLDITQNAWYINATKMTPTAAQLNTITVFPGSLSQASLLFGAQGDCTKVTIGGIDYAYNASPTVTLGQWAYGGSPGASATNLAAAINGDTRNGGASYYTALVTGAGSTTVKVFTTTVGDPATTTVTRTGGAQPATLEGFAGGVAAGLKRASIFNHTVTTIDVSGTFIFDVALPFAPTAWDVTVRDSTGAYKQVVDKFVLNTSPNRITVTKGTGTNTAATDVLIISIQE